MVHSYVLQVGVAPSWQSLSRPLPGACCRHLPPFVVKLRV